EIQEENTITITNDLYAAVNAPMSNYNSSTQVRLRYDDLKVLETAPAFTITVNFDLKKYPRSVTEAPVVEHGTLTISHTPLSKEVVEEYVYKSDGCYKAEVEITSVTGLQYLTEDIILEAEIVYDRAIQFRTDLSPSPTHSEDWTNSEVTFKWGQFQAADRYELEWIFVSSEVVLPPNGYYTAPSPGSVSFEEATRVVTSKNTYKITVPYRAGHLYYRLRAVNTDAQKQYSEWALCSSPVNIWQGNSVTPGHDFEAEKSWSYSATYSSGGLKSEQISYVDATGRVRQQIVKDAANGNIIVGEQKYGYNGEPSVQMLPGIIPGQQMKYINNFTTTGNVAFDKQHFAKDAQLINATYKIDVSSKNYFSESNPFKGDGLHDYVASAEGFGYAQTMFDAQGRVTKVSGAGPEHKMGSGHEVEIWYSTPLQNEIDRLFGNEVG
ncbi:MAG: hypothetical protein ACKOXB_07810, partial [Flavobacteriales bacterium]